jgi:hypothetical protein
MPASTEKQYYNMREPKEIFKPLLLVKDPKSGFMKQQLPKKGGGRRTKRKTKRKTRRKTKHYARA